MFNIIVFPYRDLYYEKKYGTVVRDHQMIKALSENDRVKKIHVINRPISVYETILGKFGGVKSNSNKIFQWEKVSLDLLGPLKKRLWTERCYNPYLNEFKKFISHEDGVVNVVLDFTPIAKIDYSAFPGCVVWYDAIDNFSKHNRFSKKEKDKVIEKYNLVNANVRMISGVSERVITMFEHKNKFVLHNGLLTKTDEIKLTDEAYDFGYIGFITDKFDIDLLRVLTEKTGRKAILYGKVHDQAVKLILQNMKNITLAGEFSGNDLPEIMTTFKIGLLPYKKELSHDESPLKLYEYMNYGKPVIASTQYEIRSEYVCLYTNKHKIFEFIEYMINRIEINYSNVSRTIQAELKENDFWVYKTEIVLDRLIKNEASFNKDNVIGSGS